MSDGFSGYAIVEVMGHNRFVGHVSEVTLAGAGMLLLEVPEIPAEGDLVAIPGYTKYIPPASLYCLTPISEEEARIAMERPRRYRPALPAYEDPVMPEDDDL